MSLLEDDAPAETAPAVQEEMDVSKGNFAGWTNDKFNKEMYSDEGVTETADEEKIYIDDEVDEESVDTGIDMSALDEYETDNTDEKKADDKPRQNDSPPKQNEGIMNSQRGHESTVLNSGGV